MDSLKVVPLTGTEGHVPGELVVDVDDPADRG
jgi:hypothetical protein